MPATCYVIGCTNPPDGDYCTTCQQAITTALTPRTAEEREAGMRKHVDGVARGIARRFRAGDTDDAKQRLTALPEEWRDEALMLAANYVTAPPLKTKKKQTENKVAIEAPVAGYPLPRPKMKTLTWDQQVAKHWAYRAQVSKSTRPIVEEALRRANCPRPDKVSYDDTPLGRAAADWHLNDLRNIDGVYASIYMCDCGWLHVSGGAR